MHNAHELEVLITYRFVLYTWNRRKTRRQEWRPLCFINQSVVSLVRRQRTIPVGIPLEKKYNYYYNTNTVVAPEAIIIVCFVLITYKFYWTVPRCRQQKIIYGVLTPIYAAHFFLVFVKRSYRFLENRYDISVILKIILASILHYVYNIIINYLLLGMDIYNSTSARFRLRCRSPTNCTQIYTTPRQIARLPNSFHTFWLLDICLRHTLPKTMFRHL